MRRLILIVALSMSALSPVAADTDATSASRHLLAVQRDAWNRADIEAFMRGYWRSEDIRFASGDAFKYGWRATLDGYRKAYPDAATMGRLDFDLVEVRELSPDAVYVFGKWKLTRADEAKDKAPHGLFTLIVERKDGTWVITRDHTSAAAN
ncbi:MAG: YybH family protein [Burkholderiaceae bacterium]